MERINILIIDDGDDLFRFCQQFMPGAYHFIHAHTGREAMRTLEKDSIKLIILDKSFDRVAKQELFGNDAENEGIHILETLHRDYPRLPVMMITAHADAISQRKALALGAIEYLSWDVLCHNVEYLKRTAEGVLTAGSNR